MLEKDAKGYYVEESFNARERKIFVIFLLHERARHAKDIEKIDESVKRIESNEGLEHVPTK